MASMAFTFGSFGDIVALIQLCYNLATTLRDKSSPAEYRELIFELESIREVLQSVQRATTSQTSSSIPRSCINALEIHIQKCHQLINQFIARTQPKKSMMRGEPGTNFWDFWWTVDWNLFRKGAVVELKTGLMEQKSAINVILSLSNL
jgi:Fungal N-terminal domain of STAND proteins